MERCEFLARRLAARKMGLTGDPAGKRLPDELWRQCLLDAEFILGVLELWDDRNSPFVAADAPTP